LDFVLQFTNDIRHIDGASNVVADAMSRIELNRIGAPSLNLEILAAEQKSDPDFTEITSKPSLSFEFLPLPDSDTRIHCNERLAPIIAYGGTSDRTLVSGPNTASLAQLARSTSMHEVHNLTASHANNPVSAVPTPVPPLPKTLLH
uniref:Reverse transcriptase domain-containing protein n=1 Tax=Rodentolepis nana TaxID=102285 RepID=A0A0R3T3I1_RODNA